jgi:hypothetical protein
MEAKKSMHNMKLGFDENTTKSLNSFKASLSYSFITALLTVLMLIGIWVVPSSAVDYPIL